MSQALGMTRKEEAAVRALVTEKTGFVGEVSVRGPDYVHFTLAHLAELELEFWIESAFPPFRDVWIGFRFPNAKFLDEYVKAIVHTEKFGSVPKSPNFAKLAPTMLYKDSQSDGYWVGYYEVVKAGEAWVDAAKRLLIRYPKIEKLQKVLIKTEIAVVEKIEGNAGGGDFYLRVKTLCSAVRKRANGKCEHCGEDVIARYGEDILQVHHAEKRFSELAPGETITPKSLKAVCPNCHSAIHAHCRGGKLRWPVSEALARRGATKSRKSVAAGPELVAGA